MLSTKDVVDMVRLLSVGINHAAIYDVGHARVTDAARAFVQRLRHLLMLAREDGVFLGVVERRLVHDGRFLLGATLLGRRLVEMCNRLSVGGLLFHREVDEEEITTFFRLVGERTELDNVAEARQWMTSRGVRNVSPSPRFGDPGWMGEHWGAVQGGRNPANATPAETEAGRATDEYAALLGVVEDAQSAVHHDREVDVDGASQRADGLVGAMEKDAATLLHLSRYPDYESYTVGHSVRVGLLVVLIGQRLGLSRLRLVDLATAALLHDAGKGKIPQEILFKRGGLDPQEREVMSTHAVLGAEALVRTNKASGLSIATAFGHHLRSDRRGYPRVADWLQLSWYTSLIQVCDVFEALTATRPYKSPLPPHRAYEIMLKDASAFDPTAFAALIRTLGLYPPGSRVALSDGREAFVLRAGSHPARPVLRLTKDAEGRPLPEDERAVVAVEAGGRFSVSEVLVEDGVTVVDDSDGPLPTIHTYDCGHEIAAGAGACAHAHDS